MTPDGKKNLGKPGHRWKYIIKMLIIEWEGYGFIHMNQDKDKFLAFANTVMKLQIP
jgi:hypothetical protein